MPRRPLSTELHAALDVALATLLVVLPWVFGFDGTERAQGSAVGAGAALLALGLLTRYELGLVPVVPMRVHLAFDALAAVFLLAFALGAGVAGAGVRVWSAFLVVGAAELAGAALTQTQPARSGLRPLRRPAPRAA